MDLLVEKESTSLKFSELGLRVNSIYDTPPSLDIDYKTVRGRSGRILANSQFGSKLITVNGRLKTETLYDFELLKEELKGLLVDSRPFYITKMLPIDEELYHFQLPGESFYDIDLIDKQHKNWHYRWKVTIAEDLDFVFRGRSQTGLIYDFTLVFVTAELPFGETAEEDITIRDGLIPYKGNANITQFEWPFAIELTAGVTQTNIDLTINGRQFNYEHSANLRAGDMMLIKGYETTLNGVNVNNRTNYEHFELVNGINSFETTFRGLIKILNFKNFYK